MSNKPWFLNQSVPSNAPTIDDGSIVSYKLFTNSEYRNEYHESKIFVRHIHIRNFKDAVVMPYLEICGGKIVLDKADRFDASALRTSGDIIMPQATSLSVPYLIQCKGDIFLGKINSFQGYRLKAVESLSAPYAQELVLTRLIYGDVYALRAKKIFMNSEFQGTVYCMDDTEVIGISPEHGQIKRFMTHVHAMRYSLKFFGR